MRLGFPIDLEIGGAIQHRRMNRSALDALAGSAGLVVGEVYLITDAGKLAVATAAGAYTAFEPESETGSNANGRYVRHANGVQECWARDVASGPCDTAHGTGWTGSGAWTFPAAFISTTDIVVTAASRSTVREFYRSTVTTSAATLFHRRNDGGGASATGTTFDARAVGRWKA